MTGLHRPSAHRGDRIAAGHRTPGAITVAAAAARSISTSSVRPTERPAEQNLGIGRGPRPESSDASMLVAATLADFEQRATRRIRLRPPRAARAAVAG
ncbi:hypothetical protein, partial [Burkholderia oklahomensis]|uniref:hypothetical protein n=1 Tax=Burkholderia oklahomensis TaxID=342113 RepID=UPI001E54DA35